MTADKIAKRGTPLTDAHASTGASWDEDKMFMRRLEQDRAALMSLIARLREANIIFPSLCANNGEAYTILHEIDETIAAVKAR